jgi:hypothetical protein
MTTKYKHSNEHMGERPQRSPLIVINKPSRLNFCDDDTPLVFDNTYVSKNQMFAGPANPKTLIAPIVVPPIADLEYWKNNNLTILSQINTETQRELYRNGYIVNTKCGNGVQFHPLADTGSEALNLEFIDEKDESENDESENYEHENENYERENYEPSYKTMHKYGNNICNIEDISINTSCGYDNKQILNNLPSNYNASDCEKSDAFIEYNKQLFTQNVGENMYDVNQINEPINSNIGISFQQQFQPTTYNINKYGEKIYTEYDPTIFEKDNITAPLQKIRTDNVYDPRSFGYGTNYRNYNDNLLGQPRFIYDDINSVRMPNYISRSNIDNNSFADSYGTLNSGEEFGNKYNSNIRELSNKAWLDNTTTFREELSQRLMRKRNAEMWQIRKYPKGPLQK